MTTAYIGIGSNIGDRIGYIQQAHAMLNDAEGVKVLESSSLYETEPVGIKEQEWFINAVIKLETSLTPNELLDLCFNIESKLGRTRPPDEPKNSPRTLDLDILFYDDKIISDAQLQVPHPGIQNRAYALVPFLEIDADFVHPVLKKTILEMHEELEDPEEVYLYGTKELY